MRRHTWRWRVLAALISTALLMLGWPALTAAAAGGPSVAAGRPASASSTNGSFTAAAITDGNQSTYWESAGSTFPQWVQTDLGATTRVDEVVLKLPAAWENRNQTLSVQGSPDGTSFSTLVGSATYTFGQGAGNTVTIAVPATQTRFVRIEFTANTGWPAAQLAELEVRAAGGSSANLALGKTLTASSNTQVYVASNANDGNSASYWESVNNAMPQWLQADLGASVRVDRVVLRLPENWGARTQTLKIQGSANGADFTDLTASKAYDFNAADINTVPITFDATTTRYVRVLISVNSVQPGGQLSELEIYGPQTGDTQAPTAPTALAYTEPATGQIKLTWQAATDNVGVTGYDVYANNQLRTSVAGNVTGYTDTQPTSASVTYFVRAKDAAGNQSPNSNSVTRAGDTGDTQAPTAPGALSYTEPATGQIKLTWQASTDNVGVTGYEVYANNALRTTVAGNATTYTDTQPTSATVSYVVRAKDAAGNRSGDSNSVTRNGSGGGGSNLAVGKPVTGSSVINTFVAENADDNSTATYWEGAAGAYPSTLTVKLGANADTDRLVLKLNPDSSWGARTQRIEVLGREQSASGVTSLVAAKDYAFDPASGNTVTIPLAARIADVQLRFTANSGSSNGQIAEFQIIGVPAPNPDLVVTALSATPAAPVESDTVTLAATVKNSGPVAAPATAVTFQLGGTKVATANVAALAPGASANVTAAIGPRDAGAYPLTAIVDEANTVVEQNDTNNTYTGSPLVIRPVDSSDLVASAVNWTPSAPSAGQNVAFSVTVKNQGTVAAAAGSHGITLTLLDANGATVRTLSGSFSGALAPGAAAAPVALGSWPAANGNYTVKVVLADDANELPVKRGNNSSTTSFFVGRGANMPFDMYEAEDGAVGGGASVVGPNRTIGDIAGEASGRKAVSLDQTGEYVEFTTRASTNTLVTRFSIPDAPGGGGIDSTIDVYINGTLKKALPLTSKYAWLYGAEASPGNSPGSGAPRHIYDEANIVLGETVPAGSKIRLQKDAGNTSTYAIDFVSLEQATQIANPDPATYTVPAGFGHQDVQNALDKVRMDTTGKLVGVYLPPGDYDTASKFQVYGKAVQVVGAGPWFTRFHAPAAQDNTDIGWRAEGTANGSSFSGFAYFGNYTSRIDGPGKVFDFSNVTDITIDNVWDEHTVCLYWGANTDRITIKNSRIRDTFADGINMTNGSTDNLVSNNEARSTGDDSFALFSAIDAGGADMKNNMYENLTTLLTWRAAGVAVYGGFNNTFRNILIADTLVYAGITISSLDFGYPMNGFGTDPTTFENISVIRSGGHFWGAQTFPGIWIFSASKVFQGIRINNVDIVDPTYSGIMFQTQYVGGQPVNPIKDTILRDITITGAKKSGDAYDAKSGFGLWANEMPEAGQGPAVGDVEVRNLRMSDNAVDIRNTTSTFKINQLP
ncbi:discoidin domain-containing protein [Streptomyces sp. G-G2]|uniref:discoidin domain-containing protein n=1 Tax=Streptomyces sp. G-G2 TaxID=3046201 RepID=UPI0024B932D6|nr:discoidin domain-containing protein [Streptomyces sp. G-G2]MDJ0381946.1 discoidin domain-containing protein [Streptomyces sp. G-G2]